MWQESTEIIICLLHELDYVYWPKDRKEPFKVDPDLEITLQSTKTEPGTPFVERIFTLSNTVSHTSRVVIHLQLMPAQFANEVGGGRKMKLMIFYCLVALISHIGRAKW